MREKPLILSINKKMEKKIIKHNFELVWKNSKHRLDECSLSLEATKLKIGQMQQESGTVFFTCHNCNGKTIRKFCDAYTKNHRSCECICAWLEVKKINLDEDTISTTALLTNKEMESRI